MKISNFSRKREVNFYTYINIESEVISNENNAITSIKSDDVGIYQIIDEKTDDNSNYWEIKKNTSTQSIGWINNNKLLRFLDIHPHLINVITNFVDNELNKIIGIDYYYDPNTLYTKSYMTIFNNRIFYGLTLNGEFIGFVNDDAIDFGIIKPLEFTFKSKIVSVHSTPELSNPVPLQHYDNKFTVTHLLRSPKEISIGIFVNEQILWASYKDTDINLNNIKPKYITNNYQAKRDYYINSVRANTAEYYKVNDKIGVTSKLEKIIDKHEEDYGKSQLYRPLPFRVGIICDEFMYHSLKDSADVVYIPYSEDIEVDDSFDFILVVSTWRGIDESWHYVANPNGEKRKKLLELLQKYNNMNIPTVFYSKEDPVNYDRFISIAQNCTYIFTSAVEIISNYKKDTGNQNVDFLEFSINPNYHNPIGKNLDDVDLQKQVIFAGSWMKKYPVRNKESSEIFNGVINSNYDLNIVDRNFDRKLIDYQFPVEYLPYISKTINHSNLMKLHRATSWGINLNSVKYSNTMFANRVYELQAMGNLVLSNYSMGINNKFPNLFIVNNQSDVKQVLNHTEKKDRNELIAKGISNVMLNDTAYHRMSKIANNLNLKNEIEVPKILVVGEGDTSYNSYKNQAYTQKYFLETKDYNESLNGQYDFIAFFSDKYIYEENYLINLLSGFAYTDATIIEMDGSSYKFKDNAHYNKTTSLVNLKSSSLKIFNIPKTEIFTPLEVNKSDKLLSVIIPIHNNGKYLEDKCFRSLKRSSIFNHMEIIMVDDGSNEISTLKTINRLRRRNPDIKYYRFEGASGSASRPRNKGIEMAQTKYITFLDPDNEASGDGYKLLLTELQNDSQLDLAVGNVIKEDNDKKSLLNYHYYVMAHNSGDSVVIEPKEFLIKSKLRAHSIQALIVKSEVIKKNNLRMVEGAAGQDTMFFQDLLLHSKKFKALPDLIHMYYAAVSGSVTTTIKKSFFEKYLILEKERVPFLKKHGIYHYYVNYRFPYYFKNWYLKRLIQVSERDLEYVKSILLEILSMYIYDYKEIDLKFIESLEKHFDMSFYKNNKENKS